MSQKANSQKPTARAHRKKIAAMRQYKADGNAQVRNVQRATRIMTKLDIKPATPRDMLDLPAPPSDLHR